MLAVYDVAHSLPLGGAGRDFPFTEDAFLVLLQSYVILHDRN
jgi:hypothetical protein